MGPSARVREGRRRVGGIGKEGKKVLLPLTLVVRSVTSDPATINRTPVLVLMMDFSYCCLPWAHLFPQTDRGAVADVFGNSLLWVGSSMRMCGLGETKTQDTINIFSVRMRLDGDSSLLDVYISTSIIDWL